MSEEERLRHRAFRTDIEGAREIGDAISTMIQIDSAAMDSVSLVQRTAPTTFSSPDAFGAEIIGDDEKLFASQREPIMKWLTYWVPVDIFDNWFKVVDPDNPDDTSLDRAVQQVLHLLNAKQNLIRLFTFERRYGTAVLLCAYTRFGEGANWDSPIYETGNGLNLPLGFQGENAQLLQITPYPWSKVTVKEHEDSQSSLRFSLPETYSISRGTTQAEAGPSLEDTVVHWSRLIHVATRLDENSYEGEGVVEAVWDDSVGFRNSRWGQYETIFRVGGGFPKFTFPWATRSQIQAWISRGEITNLNARGYFVCGEEGEDVEFIGPQNVSLNPEPYNELAFNMMAMATRIPKDMLKGVSAGTVAGSEVNERSYWNFISSEQAMVEPVVRELIDRIIDTGQVQYEDRRRNNPRKDYEIVWNYPVIMSEQSQAQADFLKARKLSELSNIYTVNELREMEGLERIDEGDVVLGILKGQRTVPFQTSRPPAEERRPQETVEEETREAE